MFPKPELSCTCKPTKATTATTTFGSKVLVTTGGSLTTEIIDLENSKFGCTKVGNFPKKLFNANGGLVGKTPMVCGGWYSGTFKKSCYNLEENGVWKGDEKAKLIRGKDNGISGSVVIKDQLFIPESIAKSGSTSSWYLNFEMVEPGKKQKALEPMNKWGLFSISSTTLKSCIVKWDDNTIMLIGMGASKKETFFINMGNQTITEGPKLMEGRSSHACHEMTINGEPHIIVNGGSGSGLPLKSTEILAKSSVGKGWQKGNKFTIT